jgi:hypothetical protein
MHSLLRGIQGLINSKVSKHCRPLIFTAKIVKIHSIVSILATDGMPIDGFSNDTVCLIKCVWATLNLLHVLAVVILIAVVMAVVIARAILKIICLL